MTEQQKNNTKTFSVRLDSWLYEKLITASGTKGKNEYIRNLLIKNLDEQHKNNERTTKEQDRTTKEPGQEHREDVGESARELIIELELKDEIIKSKNETIKVLENQNGFLIQDHTRISGQLDRLLMPAQEEIIKKNWWQFWKS